MRCDDEPTQEGGAAARQHGFCPRCVTDESERFVLMKLEENGSHTCWFLQKNLDIVVFKRASTGCTVAFSEWGLHICHCYRAHASLVAVIVLSIFRIIYPRWKANVLHTRICSFNYRFSGMNLIIMRYGARHSVLLPHDRLSSQAACCRSKWWLHKCRESSHLTKS